jgi:integrase
MMEQEQAELAQVLEEYKNFVQMSAKRKLKEITLENYAQHLRILIVQHGLPKYEPTVEDFRRVLTSRVKTIRAATANTAIVAARKFAEFRGLDPDSKEMRKIFQFKRVVPTKRFTREDILTPDDIIGVLSLMPTIDYKAFFAVLWDTGARVGEICKLTYEDVIKDEHGFVLDIKYSKTTARRLRLITDIGIEHFTRRYEMYREGEPLFRMRNGNQITPHYATAMLRNRRKIIGKKLCSQLFRKSASSWWKSEKILEDRDIRIRMGHKPWSKMFERYYELYFQPDYEAAELRALNGENSEDEQDKKKDSLEDVVKRLQERIDQLEKEKEESHDGPSLK